MAVGSASDLTRGFGNQPRPRSTASSVAWSSSGMHYYRFAPEVRSRRGDTRRIVWAERDSPRRGSFPKLRRGALTCSHRKKNAYHRLAAYSSQLFQVPTRQIGERFSSNPGGRVPGALRQSEEDRPHRSPHGHRGRLGLRSVAPSGAVRDTGRRNHPVPEGIRVTGTAGRSAFTQRATCLSLL